MKGYMYILKCKDNSYYVGSTNNLTIRIEEHNNGLGCSYTRERLPVKLIYYEECLNIKEAFIREQQIKGWSHKKKNALIHGNTNTLRLLSENRQSSAALRQAQGPHETFTGEET